MVYRVLRDILGSVAVLCSPLSIFSLSKLLSITEQKIVETLKHIHAILDIPKEQARPLRLYHPSFRDFLLSKDRCTNMDFWVDEKQAHLTLASNCMRHMSASLKQDICGLENPGVFITDVESSSVEKCLSPELQYACRYWVQHLQKSGIVLHDNGHVHQFLQMHFLHWLEALSWMGRMSEGILAIGSLESIVLVRLIPAWNEKLLTYPAVSQLSGSLRVYLRHEAI